jgi:hypothetical protein
MKGFLIEKEEAQLSFCSRHGPLRRCSNEICDKQLVVIHCSASLHNVRLMFKNQKYFYITAKNNRKLKYLKNNIPSSVKNMK